MLFDVLRSCEWPKEWKCALVNPAHKSGSVRSVSNHRPISILPCLSLVLERILFNHNDFKIRHKLVDCQHGYFRRRSRTTQLLLFCDQLYVWRTLHVLTPVFQRLSISVAFWNHLQVTFFPKSTLTFKSKTTKLPLLSSSSTVNCKFGCNLLAASRTTPGSPLTVLTMSSTYLKKNSELFSVRSASCCFFWKPSNAIRVYKSSRKYSGEYLLFRVRVRVFYS